MLDTGNQARRTLDFPETILRIGIAPNTELRFAAPDYYQNSGISFGPGSGFGDLAAGIKQQLRGMPGGFEASVVLMLSFPTGANGISSGGYDPSFQLPWSRKLSSNWTAAGMLSIYVPSQNGSHTVVGESTFLMDRQLTEAWDAFVEYAGDFPEAGGPRHLLHFGTACKIAPPTAARFACGRWAFRGGRRSFYRDRLLVYISGNPALGAAFGAGL